MKAKSVNSWYGKDYWLNTNGVIFPLGLGFLFALGTNGALRTKIPFTSPSFYGQIIVFTLLFWLGFCLAAKLMDTPNPLISPHAIKAGKARSAISIFRFNHELSFFGICKDATRLFLCWSPYMVLLYPGVVYWDTGDQLGQYFGKSVWGMDAGVIWDHHPFLDTYIYGAFAQFGHWLLDSYSAGLFIYTIIQAISLDLVLVVFLAYLKDHGLGPRSLRLITCFFSLFPVFPIMALSISKDVTNVVCLLLWFLLFLKLVDSRLRLLKSPVFLSGFILSSVMASLTKKMGMYIVLAGLLALIFIKCSKWLKSVILIIAVGLVVLVNLLIPRFIFPPLHVVPGGQQASIVMPIQLMARAAHDDPAGISPRDKKVVNSFVLYTWDDMAKNYNPYISDPVTGFNLKGEVSFTEFCKVWIKVGIDHPQSYINGFFSLESGWITFQSPYPHNNGNAGLGRIRDAVTIQPEFVSHTNQDSIGDIVPNKPEGRRAHLVDVLYRTITGIPLINVLFYISLWTAVIPCFILYYLWCHRREGLTGESFISLVPYFFSILSLFAYPITIQFKDAGKDPSRYMFHALVMGPIAIGLAACVIHRRTTGKIRRTESSK